MWTEKKCSTSLKEQKETFRNFLKAEKKENDIEASIKIDFVVHAAYKLPDFSVDTDKHRATTCLHPTSPNKQTLFMTREEKKSMSDSLTS